MIDLFLTPFADPFMQRALVALLIVALAQAPLGVFMMLRKMSLMGDGLSHAVLPGFAVGFLFAGLSLPLIMLCGLVAGLLVTFIATLLSRYTLLKEDAAFNSLFLCALALGVLLITRHGTAVDLYHVLFGNVLAVDNQALITMGISGSISLVLCALFYRSFILECVDPLFARQHLHFAYVQYALLYGLIVVALVSSFQALGTLMTLGVMLLPAACARLWGRTVDQIFLYSTLFAAIFSVLGLAVSYHLDTPVSVSVVLMLGGWLLLSALIGPKGGLIPRFFPRKHLEK